MNEGKSLRIRLSNGTIKECTVVPSEASPWKLLLVGSEFGGREFSGDDLFEALLKLRKQLEKDGAQLLCVGAQFDIWPSGMARSMAGGRKAYSTRLGEPAGGQLRDILDFSDAASVGTVAEQETFHKKWVESLGKA
jgi:hypothetical protein